MAFAWAGFALNVRSMNFTVCAPLPPGGQRRQQHGHAAFALAGEDIIHLRVFRQNLPRVVAHLRAAQNYICARPRSLYSGGKTQRFPNVPQIARKQHRIRLPVQNAGQHVPLRLIDGALPHLGTNTRRACGLHTRQQAPGRQRRMNVFRIECKQHRLHRPRPPLSPFLRLQIKNAASRAR